MNQRGYFAVGISAGKIPANLGMLWRSSQCFGASFIFTIGARYQRFDYTDTTKAGLHVPLFHFTTLAELHKHTPMGCDLVGVELAENAESIAAFHHPERAIYLLGAEDFGLSPEILGACKRIVQLPGKYCLNVAVAGSLVMYDRWKENES